LIGFMMLGRANCAMSGSAMLRAVRLLVTATIIILCRVWLAEVPRLQAQVKSANQLFNDLFMELSEMLVSSHAAFATFQPHSIVCRPSDNVSKLRGR
jgi:hypothetical protein